MPTIAIIAEYNPYHNGHQKQIQMVKERFGKKCKIINILSPDFVQRGEAAILSAETRAQMAIDGGSSLVLSMPAVFSTASAKEFARAGVRILSKLNLSETLVCGAENDQALEILEILVRALQKESATYQEALQTALKEGNSFPKAREMALVKEFPDQAAPIEEFLQGSNNILALEYALAIEEENLLRLKEGKNALELLTFPRKGEEKSESLSTETSISASAIRKVCREEESKASRIRQLYRVMPAFALARLMSEKVLVKQDYEKLLSFTFLGDDDQAQEVYRDFTKDMAGLLRNTNAHEEGLPSSKQYTQTRLKRAILAKLLGISDSQWELAKTEGPAFARVLAFNKDGQFLLRKARKTAEILLLNKISDLQETKSSLQSERWQKDKEILARKLYQFLQE